MQIKDLSDAKFRLRMAIGIGIVYYVSLKFLGRGTVPVAYLPCRWWQRWNRTTAQNFGKVFKNHVENGRVPQVEYVMKASNRASRYRFTGTALDVVRLIIKLFFSR